MFEVKSGVLQQIAGSMGSAPGTAPTAASIVALFVVPVADITNPTELAAIVGTTQGEWRVAVQVNAGGNLLSTIYEWDSAGAVTNSPYVVASTGGKWVAVAGRYVAGQAAFGAAVNTAQVALTDAVSIATDASLGNAFTVTLGGNRTLANPTNLVAGSTYIWRIQQDGTGSRTLAYGALFKWPAATAPTLTATAGAVDIITGYYDGTQLNCVATLAFG